MPRDDGAPTADALRIALADAQTAFSGEDDRHAALGWLLDHLSSLIADSERLARADNMTDRTRQDFVEAIDWAIEEIEDGRMGATMGTVTLGRIRDYFAASVPSRSASAPPHTGASRE